MSLTSGTRFGLYEILAPLGVGGMGEVYRARDTRLNRDVAIKVLPGAVATDGERLARFRREAQVLASLNHSNIGGIYGLEESASLTALVMELVEGEDLSQRIARGALPLDEALPIARQIVDALEAAHEQGIVHRDLKPANIKVKADGTVKVLDFGLAKALDQASGSGLQASQDVANSPTLTVHATQMGVILGTAAYMAPEQARGKAVDRRADIWAFGVVLYEMLAGRRAFEGDDISITLASVLKDDVKWELLPADLPPSLRRLLRRCLERDVKRRLSAIGDARLEFDDALTPSADSTGAAASGRPPKSRAVWIALGAVTALWIATLLPAWKYFRLEPDTSQVRFSVPDPASVASTVNNENAWYPSISPDGRMIAFLAPPAAGGPPMLWIRPVAALDAKPLPGTEGIVNPFWSPDSRSIAFALGNKLWRIEISGGSRQAICEVGNFVGGSWNQNDVIVFATGQTGALSVVPAGGGTPSVLARPDRQHDEQSYRWPAFLPDGRHVMYLMVALSTGRREVHVRALDGGTPVRLTTSDTQAGYAPGFLLFQRDRSLFAQRFDPVDIRLSGEPQVVAADVVITRGTSRGAFAVSNAGVLLYRTGNPGDIPSDLVWIDRAGKTIGTVGDTLAYNQIRLSPDGTRVAVAMRDGQSGAFRISMLDLASQVTSQLTQETTGVGTNDPIWSPDGGSVAFESMRNGKRDFFTQNVGSREEVQLFESPDDPKWLDDWSTDGRVVLFHVPLPSKLFALSLDADRKVTLLMTTPASVDSAHFSPDGKWISYGVNDSGLWETWVASFPSMDHRRQISQHGGGQAWWQGDGKEIFFLTPDGKMMSVAVTPNATTRTLDFQTPQVLFQSPLETPLLTVDQYSVTRDGQRFLFIRPRTGQAATLSPINVVTNWTAGLK